MAEASRPIACSLPARESRDQIGEWQALGQHRVAAERIQGGYAVTFDAEVADVVSDLARREAACCAFLDIVTTPTADGIRLAMTSEDPDAMPVIEILVGPCS
ncbi:MAG: hypothetical protein ACRDXD_12460 [Acidimicrobiia bacterium]